jgi:hypothetical protein
MHRSVSILIYSNYVYFTTLLIPQDLESLQFETAAEGGRLRRDVTAAGGVAPVGGGSKQETRGVQEQLSGKEEEFAFSRAVSRLLEMQSSSYHLSRRPRVHNKPVVA